MELNPDELLLFARVADSGSFSRAAEQGGLPKSTLSRRIAALEQRLGERLLTRSTRRLSLTDFGLELLDHAHRVAEEVEAVGALAEHRLSVPTGRLRVSMPPDLAGLVLPRALADFMQRHPQVRLDLDLSPRRVDLVAENFDLAVRMGRLPDDSTLVARKLAEFEFGLYAAPTYLAANPAPIDPDQLMQHRAIHLLGRDGEPRPWYLLRGDEQWRGLPPGSIAANSISLQLALAEQGAGIANVTRRFAAPRVATGSLQRVLPEWESPPDTAWAVMPERRLMPGKTRAFVDMLIEALAGCGGDAPD
jgi:DNA-binding transcriptional LysR family regulator